MLALIVVSYTFAIVRAVYLALLHVLRPNSRASLELWLSDQEGCDAEFRVGMPVD